MGRSLLRRYHDEVRGRLPDDLRRGVDGALRVGAKATKRLRNKAEIEKRGAELKKRLHF